METCIKMCPNCPKVPKGILQATIIKIEAPDIHRMAGYRLFAENPQLAREVEATVRVTVEATEVDGNSQYEERDEAVMYIDGSESTEEEIVQAFEGCSGPKQNLIQRMAKVSVCGAFGR